MPPADGAQGAAVEEGYDSPAPLADDRRLNVERLLPTRINRQAAAASEVIGGPVGLHAAVGRSRHWTPLRVVLLMALITMAFGWFGKAGCVQQVPVDGGAPGEVRLNWDNQRQFYGLCYSDVIRGYSVQRLTPGELAQGTMPYRTFWMVDGADGEQVKQYMDQPVLVGMFMYGAAQLTVKWQRLAADTPIPDTLDVVAFFNISALILALFWLIAVWATMRTEPRRLWMAALMAISPLVLVHAFTAFEVIPVMFTALAMLCWARRRPLPAGLFLGLAVASALYPLLLLVALAVICVRDRRMPQLVPVVLGAVTSWLVVNLPILLNYPNGWSQYYRSRWLGADEPDSLYRVIIETTGWNPSTTLLNVLWLLLLAAVIAGVVWVGLRADKTPHLAELMFLLVAGYLLVGKSWTPQSSLWLVPLAVLALPYARLLIAWMIVDALVWVPRMGLFLDPEAKWLPDDWFYVTIVIRAAFVLVLCGLIVYRILRRRRRPLAGYPDLITTSPVPAVPRS